MTKPRTKKTAPVAIQPTKPPERVRPPRKPIKLRWESMWYGVENTSMFVHNVAAWGAAGDPKIPAFQRGLVWEPSDELLLADSIDLQLPIGTLVLWEPTHRGETWVVDGQQRVNALARMRRGETAICFDCDDDRYVIPEVADPLRHCPIASLFDVRPATAWLRRVYDVACDADDETYARLADRIDRLDAARARLRDARVAVILIHKPDESFVREVFRRLNTTGKPFAEAEVFAALARVAAPNDGAP